MYTLDDADNTLTVVDATLRLHNSPPLRPEKKKPALHAPFALDDEERDEDDLEAVLDDEAVAAVLLGDDASSLAAHHVAEGMRAASVVDTDEATLLKCKAAYREMFPDDLEGTVRQ